MSTEVEVQDMDAFLQAIADIRSDATETNWGIFGHVDNNPNLVCSIATGSGGVEEFKTFLDDKQVQYGLLRFEEQFEMSVTLKFVFIRFVGPEVSFSIKGRFGVIHGSVEKHFHQKYHIFMESETMDDINEDSIRQKIQENSGTKDKVLEASEGARRQERGYVSHTTKSPSTPSGAGSVTAVNKSGSGFSGMSSTAKTGLDLNVKDEVYQAIQNVRSDDNETKWCVIGYEKDTPKTKTLVVVDSSSEEFTFSDCLTPERPLYILCRSTDIVDDIPTVKYCLVCWVGDNVKPLDKGKLTTQKGAIDKIFDPFHVIINASQVSDASKRQIEDKIALASGSKSKIK